MDTGKIALLVMVIAVFVSAQTIQIKGTVKDSASAQGIGGASIMLQKATFATTSASDGSFSLSGSYSEVKSPFLPARSSLHIHKKTISLTLTSSAATSFAVYSLSGRLCFKLQKNFNAGAWSFTLPRLGSGAYLFDLAVGPFHCITKDFAALERSFQLGGPVAKSSRASASIADTLLILKAGYTIGKMYVTNFNSSGVEIRLHRDTATAPLAYRQPTSMNVAQSDSAVIVEPASGLTFVFTKGSNGTLTVAPAASIDTAAVPVPGCSGYQISFSANSSLTLRKEDKSNAQTSMFVWGDVDSSGYRWHPVVPRVPGDGFLYFDLFIPSLAVSAKMKAGAKNTFSIITVTADLTQQQQNIIEKCNAARDSALKAMDDALENKVRSAIAQNRLNYVWVKQENCFYDGFPRWMAFWRKPNPTLTIQDAPAMITNTVTSHEIGHYMTHMIFGNERFMAIVDSGPDAHSIGSVFDNLPRRSVSLSEDYAYYMQFVMTGKVDAYADPTKVATSFFKLFPPALISNDQPKSYDPTVIDIPGVEGFATCLMAYCTHTDTNTITDFKGSLNRCPAIGARPGEVLNIYQNCPIRISDLFQNLCSFAETKGKANAATIIAERCGWSYHGNGRMVYRGTTTGVANKQVINIVTVNGVEYRASDAYTTTSGVYTLPRVFPGKSQLKYWPKGATAATVDLTVRDDFSTADLYGLPLIEIDPNYDVKFYLSNVGTDRTFTLSVDGADILTNSVRGTSVNATVALSPGDHTIVVTGVGGSGTCTWNFDGNLSQVSGSADWNTGSWVFNQRDLTKPQE